MLVDLQLMSSSIFYHPGGRTAWSQSRVFRFLYFVNRCCWCAHSKSVL